LLLTGLNPEQGWVQVETPGRLTAQQQLHRGGVTHSLLLLGCSSLPLVAPLLVMPPVRHPAAAAPPPPAALVLLQEWQPFP
jgi:hypothetical protein